MIGPRAVLTTTAPFGSRASSAWPSMAPGFRGQRRVDRQGVGLAQQVFEAGRAGDAERELGAVRQMGVVEHDPKTEGARPQRHRGADAAEPDDAKGLHAEPADQLAFDRPPGRGRVCRWRS